MRSITTFLLLVVFLSIGFSCKKEETPPDKLDGEIGFLVGKWELIYITERVRENVGDGYGPVISKDTIFASSINDLYIVEFKEMGEFIIYKNDEITDHECTYINLVYESSCIQPQSKTISIFFEANPNNTTGDLSICGKEGYDTLSLGTDLTLAKNSYTTEHYKYYYSHFFRRIE